MQQINGLPLAIVTADWHIKPGLRIWRYRPKPNGDILFAVHQIVTLCKTYDVPLLLLGDVLDSSLNPPDCIAVLIHELEDIPIFFIQGQHDKSIPPWPSTVRKDCYHLHNKTLHLGSFTFVGCDFVLDERLFSQLPKGQVLCTHQVWRESPIGIGFSVEMLPDCFINVISGDYHFPYRVQTAGRRLVFPGVPAPTNIREFSHPSVLLICEADGKLDFVRIFLKSRPYFEHEFTDIDSFSQFISEMTLSEDLPEGIREPVVRLIIDEENLPIANSVLMGRDDIFVYIDKKSRPMLKQRSSPLNEFKDLQGLVYQIVETDYPNCGNIALRILKSASDEDFNRLASVPEDLRRVFENRSLL